MFINIYCLVKYLITTKCCWSFDLDQSFSVSAILTFFWLENSSLKETVLCIVGMLSCMPGLYLLGYLALSGVVTNRNVSRLCQMSCGGKGEGKQLPVQNNWFRWSKLAMGDKSRYTHLVSCSDDFVDDDIVATESMVSIIGLIVSFTLNCELLG